MDIQLLLIVLCFTKQALRYYTVSMNDYNSVLNYIDSTFLYDNINRILKAFLSIVRT